MIESRGDEVGYQANVFCNVFRVIAVRTILLVGFCTLQQATAASDNLSDRVHRLMSAHYPADQPGASVLVARDDQIIFRRAYGLASLELQVPVSPEMVFGLASVTKLFTAVAAMMLVEDGRLQLDDEVMDYLPVLDRTEGVTIAHLLSHTSGLTGPVTEIPGYRDEHFHREITSGELIASYADYPLKFKPGEQFRYSNEGTATLARIIEITSGQSWEAFLKERIFQPAGMSSTFYAGHNRIIPLSVSRYTKHEQEWKQAGAASFTRGFGMGALFSTVDDLFSFYRALISGRLVKAQTLETMLTPFPLKGDGVSRHGFGFVVTNVHGHRLAGHGGSFSGISTFLVFLPDDGIFVTVLTNRTPGEHTARDDAMAIIRLMLK